MFGRVSIDALYIFSPILLLLVFLETDLVVGRASAASRSSLAKTAIRSRLIVYIC